VVHQDVSVLTTIKIIDLLVCSRGIGGEVDEGTRQWSGPSCAVVDLVFFWLTHQPHLTQWLKVMHRVERNTFINSLHFVQIGVTLSNIFEHCVFAIGDRCSEPVIEWVPDLVILTGHLTCLIPTSPWLGDTHRASDPIPTRFRTGDRTGP